MSPTLLHIPRIQRLLAARMTCTLDGARPQVALTFDDGPSPRNTPPLLDLLARRGVRATFFLVGRRVRRFPSIAARIAAEGHVIGNHTTHHLPLPLLPLAIARREVAEASREIEAATGVTPRLFRPPMGWFTGPVLRMLAHEGMQPVLGSIHPEDSRQPPTEEIVRRVMERVQSGSIVILHDGGWRVGVDRSRTIAAVDRLITELDRHGFELRPVD